MIIDHWMFGAVALGAGLLLGELGGRLTRAAMSREHRSAEVREMARPVGTALFWAGTAVGLLVAVASATPETFDKLPQSSLDLVPRLLAAALFVMAGYALGVGLAALVGQSVQRATAVRHRGLERSLRLAVMAASIVLALGQLGVDTMVLVIVLAALLGAPSLAIALLTAFGGRDVATNLAAGRALRGQLELDRYLVVTSPSRPPVRGVIVAIHAVTVEVLTDDMATVHVPLRALLDHPFEVHPHRAWAS
jgi:hypothetical protein